ncbi:hypothetical protein BS78_05G265200 [Paspalum vaginatum]|nr:hypothetical protein BS78_05G265200 [Paspalum vaginatum]KAJ1277063.1 hypothetical protein BS78_05G265200 [Paspalum vaginatum]
MDDPAAASWGPCEFQPANWTAEEPAAADVWVEQYWPIDIFDSCSIQACVPGSRGAEQPVERCCYYSAASQHQHDGPSENPAEAIIDVQSRREVIIKKNSGKQSGELTKVIVTNDSGIDARGVFEQISGDFEDDMKLIKKKMHRYPAALAAVDQIYTVPKIVSIGPYHHDKPDLKKAEKVKHMAAIQCVRESGHSMEEVYSKVVSVADDARRLYDKDVMAGIGCDDFRHMMFFDACFLVQYILMQTESSKVDQSLCDFFGPNRKDIFQDIIILENQLPWKVLHKVMGFSPVTYNPIKKLMSYYKGYLQDQQNSTKEGNASRLTFDKDYKPRHLLGLLRHCAVEKISDDRTKTELDTQNSPNKKMKKKKKKVSISISAMELAEIGIKLRANMMSTDLFDMGLQPKGALCAELSLPPLSLDHNRARYLVNMAALELCTVRSFKNDPVQDSAVCSYLQLLALLVHKEDDVHELRAKGVLQGGGGLTNQQVLGFFNSLQGQRRGKLYRQIMRDIEAYKAGRWPWTMFYAFLYRNWAVIAGVVSAIGVVGGIIVTLLSIRKGL